MSGKQSCCVTRFCALSAVLASLLWTAGCTTLPKTVSSSSQTTSSKSTASGTSSGTAKTENKEFTLAYSSTDTLNPFKAATRNNLEICSLLYEGLTSMDSTLMPVMDLASSVSATSSTELTATLSPKAVFSDGTAVTADDVEASFELAKSSSNYRVLLSNVRSASAEGSGTIVFALSSPDPNALACLSFPVIKKGTDSSPVGSGRYVYKSGSSPTLKANSRNAAKPSISVIHLMDLPDGDSIVYALESGSISFSYTDLSDGEIPNTSGASVNVPLNYMVFLGVNANKTGLSDASVRTALSSAVDRTQIAASAFAGRAKATVSPFNPYWASASKLKGFETAENLTAAVAQLQKAGYNGTSGNKLSLELVVSKGNSFYDAAAKLIKQQLANAGISVTVTALAYKDYCSRLKSGDFDLYLGEIRLPANMSLSSFFSSGGSTSWGIKTGGTSAAAYEKYRAGDNTLQEFTTTFVSDVPFIPLCWQEGMVSYNRSLTKVSPTAFDVFSNIEKWSF